MKIYSLIYSFIRLALLAVLMALGLSGSASAFHEGGVARCEGCHTMHDSLKGVAMTAAGGPGRAEFTGNAYLLQGSDASSTCLNCHGKGTALDTYHVATGVDSGYNGTYLPAQRTPGGDFSWLKVAFSTISTSAGAGTGASFGPTANETKNRHGHHIVAADYSYLASTDYATNLGPGGIYRVGNLGCNSCHNPHSTLSQDAHGGPSTLPISMSGSYGGTPDPGTSMGIYRLLGGIGYTTSNAVSSGFSFVYNPPSAVAPITYNQSEATDQVAVAYGQGMSEWCANCHGNLLNNASDATSTHRHVASNSATNWTDPVGVDLSVVYNAYVNTGNRTGGVLASSYSSLAPFERGGTDPSVLIGSASNTAAESGPTNGVSHVMCLSCHRAHASGFDSIVRFDIANCFITDSTGNIAFTNGANAVLPDTSGYYSAAYYDRPGSVFGLAQRSWCNKCHGKG